MLCLYLTINNYFLLKAIREYNFITAELIVKSQTFKCPCDFLYAIIKVLKCTEAKISTEGRGKFFFR